MFNVLSSISYSFTQLSHRYLGARHHRNDILEGYILDTHRYSVPVISALARVNADNGEALAFIFSQMSAIHLQSTTEETLVRPFRKRPFVRCPKNSHTFGILSRTRRAFPTDARASAGRSLFNRAKYNKYPALRPVCVPILGDNYVFVASLSPHFPLSFPPLFSLLERT